MAYVDAAVVAKVRLPQGYQFSLGEVPLRKEGMGATEIAWAVGCKRGNVYSRRALSAFRPNFAERLRRAKAGGFVSIGLHRLAGLEPQAMTLGSGRDFLGYGRDMPQARWPGDAKVAVSFVVNFEEGAEFAISDGDPTNEAIYEVDRRLDGLPDLCLDSHFEYGARAGWWRIMETFDAHGAKATVSACGRAVERTPELARDAVARGHEVSAHGWRWESHAGMSETEERDRISRTVAAIAAATGRRPVGWHTRSAASLNTRRLLMEEGGFLYDSDANNDDLPFVVGGPDRPHVVLPYAFDTNDMQFHNTNRFARAADFAGYVLDAFDTLHREGAHAPKMMSVGLHLRIIGRPGRTGALDEILASIRARGGVWIARREDIARHWLKRLAQVDERSPAAPDRQSQH